MKHSEITHIIADNIQIMGRLSNRLNTLFEQVEKKSRKQIHVLVRLYLTGKTKLRDFANREVSSTANLCIILRKLESENLVMRTTDKDDHRDTWYQVTKSGQVLAEKFVNKFMSALENLWKTLPEEDEEKLLNTAKTMNEILKKMELANA